MQQEQDGYSGHDLDSIAVFESDFQAWRRSWMESLRDDYANLSYYRAANSLLKPPTSTEGRVVFFGDSITEGWKLEEYFPGKPYINRGICGQTTSQMLLRFRQDVIALRPMAAVILAGINDLGGNTGPMLFEDTVANYASMAEIAQANNVRMIVCSLLPPPRKGTPQLEYNLFKHPAEKILKLNRWLKEYSTSNGCDFLDYFAAMSDSDGLLKPGLSEDGLHPTPAGYLVMAQTAEVAIDRALIG